MNSINFLRINDRYLALQIKTYSNLIMLNKDNFLTQITGKEIYKSFKKNDLSQKNLQKPFFVHFKLKKPISKKKIQEFNPHFFCKQINFKKKYQKKNLKIYQDCRPSTKKDRSEILKICKENTSNSRFVKDSFFRKLLKYPLRYYWLENSFRNKPGKFLIVCLKNKKIGGFCLLQKIKKKLNINIICTSKKFSNQKIGSSIIAYVNNKIMKKYKIHLYAGTQDYNTHALSFYKKNKFIHMSTNYIYHIKNKGNK